MELRRNPKNLIQNEHAYVPVGKIQNAMCVCVNGGPDRTRTYDPALIKRML